MSAPSPLLTVAVIAETECLAGAIADLTSALERFDEVPQRLVREIELLLENFPVDLDSVSTSATELRVRFRPSERFLRLLAAVRAGDFDGQ